ncbi:MAG: peptidoglycan editing factor PgeF [Nitrospirae bacterium]|nr:peptidoglycan editing factor PgeF [Nitrospirota bacterium]
MNRLIIPDIFKGHVTGFFTGKDPGADVDAVAKILKIKKEAIYMPVQKHTDKIVLLESSPEPKIADAVITKEKGILIGIQVADCVPVLVYEKRSGIAGAVHAGWRGTAEEILKKTIKTIIDRFICDPADILLAIGPSIKGCCYGVDYDVMHAVRHATGEGGYVSQKGEKYCLDLAAANRQQALSMGVPEANIWMSEDCTFCNPDRYYSYRYSRGSTGRQAGFIGMI